MKSHPKQSITVKAFIVLMLGALEWAPMQVRGEDEFSFFESKIRPVLVGHCYECHSVKHGIVEANYNMDTRDGMLAGGDRGIAIIAGNAEASLLFKAIRYTHDDLEMPPSGRLNADTLRAIEDWINGGAVMPEGNETVFVADKLDIETAQNHWAFTDLDDRRAGKSDGEVVDYWIRKKQKSNGVRMQAEADPGKLVRRLSMSLTGLPPQYEDVLRYERNGTPAVYGELLNKYLASPQYGERWARHWLDLVRYTDTTASWLKSTAGAWRYRDWVINSLNEDVGYDRFVKLQFAADTLDSAEADDMAALGMLGLSPTYWKEPRLAPVVLETVIAEEWEERIDMVGRTFLGMSLACARCHDHKFDPVSQKDYYSLAGVFANTRVLDVPILSAERRREVVAATAEIRDLNDLIHRETLARSTAEDKSVHDTRLREAEERIEVLKKITEADVVKVPGVIDASVSVIAESDEMSKVVYEEANMVDVALQHRGNPGAKGEVVARRFLMVFDEKGSEFKRGSGRLDLAEALFKHSGFLVARVIVNRVWGHHFGQHLVSTPSNFGLEGDLPSHPELLDTLARRLIERGWSLKWLHRTILQSNTYKQSSQFHERYVGRDPDNRWYWSVQRRRLDIESWRDSMLKVSGLLDDTLGGKPISLMNPENNRRTIYAEIRRRELDEVLKMHGFPEATGHNPKREKVDTPLQQLYALNSEFIWRCAESLVSNLAGNASEDAIIEELYRVVYQRVPTENEKHLGLRFLHQKDGPEGRLVRYAHALLISNEFAFVE